MNLLSDPRVIYCVDSFDKHQILLGFAHITSSSGGGFVFNNPRRLIFQESFYTLMHRLWLT
ncbi:9966_t:CDS:2 [Funneliformis mosseae]|uniref:9966_t:CDS:1 n=1 Tax=Funneliformis mosseae TaxID=27381 RepID=A0A9N9E347_FUNMO|nr:9966_t:CDS:2 [Funneliformis mosseae]